MNELLYFVLVFLVNECKPGHQPAMLRACVCDFMLQITLKIRQVAGDAIAAAAVVLGHFTRGLESVQS